MTRAQAIVSRGFFEIGVYHSKTYQNIGTLFRSAIQLGAAGVFTVGKRYDREPSDTYKTWRHIPLRNYLDMESFSKHRPFDTVLVGIEMGGKPLSEFKHPERAIYLLGAEDHGLPSSIVAECQHVVSIEAVKQPSFNVAVAGSIVMYHRHVSKTTTKEPG